MSTMRERILECRKEAMMTRKALAEKLNCSQQAVYGWESGTYIPKFDNVVEMAKLFDVNLAWLNLGEGEKRKAKEEPAPVLKDKVFYTVTDKRHLEDIELCIKHLRSMNCSLDEKKAIHLTLSELRADLEAKVIFGGM